MILADEMKKSANLEEIIVTAQKRSQDIKDVPISISTVSGEKFDSLFSGGEDILAIATRVPGLYAETSNGRVAPRFYIRGLGNTDFDLAASQPVSIVMDEVVKENVILKSFPVFDVKQVEVLRGPQGTLFGRNTTAGMVKFDSVLPSQEFDAYVKAGAGTLGTLNLEAAAGGAISETLSARFSLLSQNRDDWISNAYTGEDDVMGGFSELAWRAQFLLEPSDDFSALLNIHRRDLDGTSTIFRANALTSGSNDLNDTYDRDTVYYDAGDNNPQEYDNTGASLKLDFGLGDLTLTSISAYETLSGRSKGDIDGGVLTEVPEDIDGDGTLETSYPGFIPFTALTEDKMDDFHQITQEFRLASDDAGSVTWQAGLFYFDSAFDVITIDGFYGATTVTHENTSWAAFGQMSFDVSDQFNITGGIRYTVDEKSLVVGEQNVDGFALVIGEAEIQDYDKVEVDDDKISWELSGNYLLSDATSVFARVAYGFRAPTIQARDVAFESAPSVADSETVTSVELGVKSDVIENVLRLNGSIYHYVINDMQFSAIGGEGNFTRLLNADKGIGQGFELEAEWLPSDYLTLSAGFSYNDTEIDDDQLRVLPCGSGQCTVVDDIDDDGNVIVDGNPFPQAPETTFNFSARFAVPMGTDGEFYAYTDWAFQGETQIFLYDSVEYKTKDNFEGGLRIGYNSFVHDYSVSVFGRNITDEENVRGGIDFNNLTVIDNSPRVMGVEFKMNFN
ncbi:Pesticin receptor [Thalassocella blandensis]|nr:Pesticin receptor [Thalassocella blandensis]